MTLPNNNSRYQPIGLRGVNYVPCNDLNLRRPLRGTEVSKLQDSVKLCLNPTKDDNISDNLQDIEAFGS